VRVRRIRLENFRRFRASEAELPDGVTAVLGPNGAGKSTLLEAISFALFGPAALRTSKEGLRFDGAAPSDAVRVSLDLELGGQALRIERELRGKALTPAATLMVDGAVLVPGGAGSSEAATREMSRRLGMDLEAFHTTVVAQQGELARLAQEKPAERKRLILRMLGIEAVDRAIEGARSRRNAAVDTLAHLRPLLADVAALDAAIETARGEARLARARIESNTVAWDAARARLASAQAATETERLAARESEERRFSAERLGLAAAQAAGALQSVRRAVVEAQVAAARSQNLIPIAGLFQAREQAYHAGVMLRESELRRAAAQKRVEAQRGVVLRIERELATLGAAGANGTAERLRVVAETLEKATGNLAIVESRQAELRARGEHIGHLGAGAPCPTCERPLADHLPRLQAATARALEETLAQQGALRNDVAALRDESVALQRRLASDVRRADLLHRLDEEQARLAEWHSEVGPPVGPPPDMLRLQRELEESRRAHEERLRVAEQERRLPALQVEAAAAETAWKAAEAAHQEARKALVPFDPKRLAAAERALDAATIGEREAERAVLAARAEGERANLLLAERERQAADARLAHVQAAAIEEDARLWTALAGRAGDGLLDRFRDHVVGRIGPAVSAEASRLLGVFSDGRYTELRLGDDYEVFVTEGGVPYTLNRFSGGEADLAHLALRLAVSRLLAERPGGAEMRFLALDEVFGSLDRDRRGLVVAAFGQLENLYAQVLVISHIEGLQDALGQAIVVDEHEGESSLRLHND
jgi:exonuclease SbcC